MEVKSSWPVCVAVVGWLFFLIRRREKSVGVLYACLNIYHMFEFHQVQRLLKIM